MNNMRLPKLTYHEPTSLGELLSIKQELKGRCAVLAGGTDLIPMLKRRNLSARHLVNIKRISALREISFDDTKGLRIGGAVTLRDVIDHPLISTSYPQLAQAARSVGFNQLRNMATLGGNVCLDNKCSYFNQSSFWWKSRPDCFKRGGDRCYVVKGGKECFSLSAADTVPALISLDAELLIRRNGTEHHLPVERFHTGDGRKPHLLADDEVVVGISVPPASEGWRGAFLKKSTRGSVDFAVASLSVRIKMEKKQVRDMRIALNAVSVKPIRAKEAESYCVGKELGEETIQGALDVLLKEVIPLSPVSASAFLRRSMIRGAWTEVGEMLRAGRAGARR